MAPAFSLLFWLSLGVASLLTSPLVPALTSAAAPAGALLSIVWLLPESDAFGAWPIVEALALGASIVITGRTTDTGLTLAPMIHEFGWKPEEWDKMAAGTIAGHILECGGQASGGNFGSAGEWAKVQNFLHLGYPIAEVSEDGSALLTKAPGTGGRVSFDTLRQQSMDRRLRVRAGPQQAEMVLEGRTVLNFGSNDYLALAADPRLAEAERRLGRALVKAALKQPQAPAVEVSIARG